MPEHNASEDSLDRLERESHEERAEHLDQVRAEAERDDRLIHALIQAKPHRRA